MNFFKNIYYYFFLSWEHLFMRIRCSLWNLFQSLCVWWQSSQALYTRCWKCKDAWGEGPALEESCEMTKYALLWWLILKQVMLVGLHRFWILRNYLLIYSYNLFCNHFEKNFKYLYSCRMTAPKNDCISSVQVLTFSSIYK